MSLTKIAPNKRIKADGTEMVFLGLFLSPELKSKLQEWAKSEDRSLTAQVTRVLRDAVAKAFAQ